MKKELLDELKQDFPELFARLSDVAIRDGWFQIVYSACDIIHDHIVNDLTIYPEEMRNQIYFTTIKEKFGTLRMYLSHHDEYIDGVVALTEYISCNTCEICGKDTAKQCTVGGYIQTLCDDHEDEAIEAYSRRKSND